MHHTWTIISGGQSLARARTSDLLEGPRLFVNRAILHTLADTDRDAWPVLWIVQERPHALWRRIKEQIVHQILGGGVQVVCPHGDWHRWWKTHYPEGTYQTYRKPRSSITAIQAIHFALEQGAERIRLVGYDLAGVGGFKNPLRGPEHRSVWDERWRKERQQLGELMLVAQDANKYIERYIIPERVEEGEAA